MVGHGCAAYWGKSNREYGNITIESTHKYVKIMALDQFKLCLIPALYIPILVISRCWPFSISTWGTQMA